MQYQQRPLKIDAWQWMGRTLDDWRKFCKMVGIPVSNVCRDHNKRIGGVVETSIGRELLVRTDYLVKGLDGELRCMTEQTFNKAYEPCS